MAEGAITVTIDDAEVHAALARVLARLGNMAPVMEDIGLALGNLTEDAFESSGPGWPALSPVTVARRGSAGPILQVSGQLVGGITHGGDAAKAWVGADKQYATAQQFGMPQGYAGRTRRGAPIPWGDIPPRPYLPIQGGDWTPPAKTKILDILTQALESAVGQGRCVRACCLALQRRHGGRWASLSLSPTYGPE